MKNINILLGIFTMLLFSQIGQAQQIGTWSSAAGDPCAPAAGGANGVTGSTDPCLTMIDLCRESGLNQGSGADFNNNDFDITNTSCADAQADNECLTWGYSVGPGCTFTPSILEFELDRSTTGPPTFCLEETVGATTSVLTASTAISTSGSCQTFGLSGTIVGPETVTYRLCAWGGTSVQGTMDIEEGSACSNTTGIGIYGTFPTPINMKTFTGQSSAAGIELKWATSLEDLNDYFEVQHSSDGRNFVPITKISSQGAASDYQYLHEDAAFGKNYYRLRQVDIDGKFVYTGTIQVMNETDGIQVYPTHAWNEIKIASSSSRGVEVDVYSLSGQYLQSLTFIGETSLDVSNYAVGWYIVKTKSGGARFTKRFHVQ